MNFKTSFFKASDIHHHQGLQFQLLFATLLKICNHPDLITLTRFERLVIAIGRWSSLWLIKLVQSGINLNNLFKSCSSTVQEEHQLRLHVEHWRNLYLDQIEMGLVESLAITGKGNNSEGHLRHL